MMWTDAIGVEHGRADDNARIVSLVPSLTETLFDLGLGPQVVGRTKWCIHPKGRVEAAISLGGTKKINLERFRSLGATHAVVNIDENPKEMVEEIQEMGTEILVTHPNFPMDNHKVYELLGGVFDHEDEAQRLSGALDEAMVNLGDGTTMPKTAVYLIWKDPWMTVSGDTYISRMLALIGWETLGHEAAVPSPEIETTGESIAAAVRYPEIEMTRELIAAADLVLFSSEPYSFTEDDLKAFAREYGCPAGKLQLIDGEMTSWFGSRAIQGIEYLSRIAQERS